jgi:prolipoprotein diacylglyceryltransferase
MTMLLLMAFCLGVLIGASITSLLMYTKDTYEQFERPKQYWGDYT